MQNPEKLSETEEFEKFLKESLEWLNGLEDV